MIETVKVLLHSVASQVKTKAVEILGWSVNATLFILSQISTLELIDKVLQICVLIVSLAGGIATFLYVLKKMKKLDQ